MNLFLNNNTTLKNIEASTGKEVKDTISFVANLDSSQYYLLQNGKLISDDSNLDQNDIYVCLRLCGGKGGFGSMLRAIGAQIEKTTNREACRDLSGRRLRDINEEKRMKTWLEKQKDKEEETEDKKKKKLEKMLVLPKIDFKDEAYELARTELTQQVGDSVEQGFKKAHIEATSIKRKLVEEMTSKKKKPKKKGALWVGAEDLSSSSETDSDSDSNISSEKSSMNNSDPEVVTLLNSPTNVKKPIFDSSEESTVDLDK